MATLQSAKRELRRRIKKILAEVSQDSVVAQSSIATKTLLSLPEYHAAKRLSIYLSMPSGEISTTAIVRDAFSKGKMVYVPYLHKADAPTAPPRTSVMDMLALRSLEEYEALGRDKWGIPTIEEGSVPGRKNALGGYGVLLQSQSQSEEGNKDEQEDGDESGLDFIVMPGLAFDEGLRRLGHGKGYYDHFLMRCGKKAGGKPYLAALALKEQVLPPDETVPTGSYDLPVDAVLLGDGRILASNSS
ncbi:5-formyltetrahydrofolate cyclo-ligase [Polytolypa hystricis UAMH7299]|uniref:5-formyltetrahydrofolate cyclo-ligase n=1 Tax=Polytolypa hystricis (strain UAMH7299) TaxID=1447883 RepID=A0A2B7WMP2_POLH7|nr:5-formyltetrahydrofolate cyclo-ligase [Polytolypa hystricis UAMH7299]